MPSLRVLCAGLLSVILLSSAALAEKDQAGKAPAAEPVSYFKQIRPIVQAQCQGCHQPAKPMGGYVMTDLARLRGAGDSGKAAIVAGKPADSELIHQITAKDGKAAMPKKEKPLHASEVELICRWIAEGAKDDTPALATRAIDEAHPPIYTLPPVITALDYAPDGKLLAVAGFHEVLLTDPVEGKLVGRLVGLSERVQAVKFSPDGKQLAVAGGNPGRFGELQVWDVARKKLLLSRAVGFDTLYGASWSPDGALVAVGCPDNNVRVLDARTGEQKVQQGAHSDWVLDTVFSRDGSHLISVGRDMTAKLTEMATGRFVDNITSITPGALKGGIQAVERHPERDEVVVGGSDGTPKVYRIYRQTARQIGDDANLIQRLPAMTGRVFSVAVSRDGFRIAAGSALDNKGQVFIYPYPIPRDARITNRIKAIEAKREKQRKPAEKAELDRLRTALVTDVVRHELPTAGVYAVAIHPEGTEVAAAGSDGAVRLIDSVTGKLIRAFAPAPLAKAPATPPPSQSAVRGLEPPPAESLPAGAVVAALEVEPRTVALLHRHAYAQLLVTARLASGDVVDATRMAEYQLTGKVADVDRGGVVQPRADGTAELHVRLAGKAVTVPLRVAGMAAPVQPDFVADVAPVLARLGCNQGTCHGSAQGKNGFKLSLRGYDPIFDVRALTDDLAARRVNVAAADDSLMLLKSTGAVPHVGGALTRPGEPYCEIIRAWIAGGAKLNLNTAKVTRIELTPINPIVPAIGQKQQIRVLASFADGKVRDVTHEAFIESANTEVATIDRRGLATAVRRGESALLARFEGAYAATTLTVMGDRGGFTWSNPPAYNRIDELTAAKWQRMKIQPSDVCSDAEFIRRAFIDLTGLPPSADDVRKFLADPTDSRIKRDRLVDSLVGSKDYVEYWTNKWADLLQVNSKFLGAEGAVAFRKWIREEVAKNTPYDDFVRKVLTASGSNRVNPAASYFKILRDPAATMENTTHLFLAVRFNCNKCHDHPFERWTQDQYYQTAAYFARTTLQGDPESKGRNIGGTAVEGAKPLFEVVADQKAGEIKHDRTGAQTAPAFPYSVQIPAKPDATRREQLAAWITAPDNPYFARSYVNRLWGYAFGVGIIEPIDDIRAGNPPSNPELLDYLTSEFLAAKFDVRHMHRLICKSRTYQLSIDSNRWNEDDRRNFSHAIARRLPAEVLYDSLHRVVGSVSHIPGMPAGSRAAEVPDSAIEVPGGFLGAFGRPVRESACECERTGELQLGPVMALLNGKTISEAINDPANELSKLVATEKEDGKLINELFLRILNRTATPQEVQLCQKALQAPEADHAALLAALKKREAEVASLRGQQEQERQQAIARAKKELADHEKAIAAQQAEAEKARQGRIAAAEKALRDHEASLPARLAAWEKTQTAGVEWVVVEPKTLKAPNGTTLKKLEDGSILAGGANGRGNYVVTAETDLADVTAIRLEAITDKSLPRGGPGRAFDGNFVLTQLTVTARSKKDPKQMTPVALHQAKASFNQQNYAIAGAVDGSPNGGKGWAIAPQMGLTHWAVLETKTPVGYAGGTVWTFTFSHQFGSNQHQLGRFRLAIARAKPPVALGLSDDYRQIVQTPVEKRSVEQKELLTRYFRAIDPQMATLQQNLNAARQPLPPDPRLLELRSLLTSAEQPLPEDERLAQLRRDLEQSTQQVSRARLTGVQDIAWALLNSPAFLFNR